MSWSSLVTTLRAAYPQSLVGRLLATLDERWRRSLLYRYASSEPDPDVVVIDLRKTRTLGPLIRGLDWLGRRGPVRRVGGVLEALVRTIGRFLGRAPVRWASAVLVGVTVGWLLARWGQSGTPMRLVGVAFLVIGVIGLSVDQAWRDIRTGVLGQTVRTVLEPPAGDETREDDG